MKKLSADLLYKSVLGEIERDLSENVIGGASIMVSQCGEIILSEMRGYSNIETMEPLRADSIFRLASMLLSGGSLDGVRIVSPESIRLMSTPIVPLEFMGQDATGSWGLGVYCRTE